MSDPFSTLLEHKFAWEWNGHETAKSPSVPRFGWILRWHNPVGQEPVPLHNGYIYRSCRYATRASMTALRNDTQDHLVRALGEAVVTMWGRLPSNIQHDLFLEAARSDPMRQRLAVFLHDRHPRTSDHGFREITEPDSLGG